MNSIALQYNRSTLRPSDDFLSIGMISRNVLFVVVLVTYSALKYSASIPAAVRQVLTDLCATTSGGVLTKCHNNFSWT